MIRGQLICLMSQFLNDWQINNADHARLFAKSKNSGKTDGEIKNAYGAEAQIMCKLHLYKKLWIKTESQHHQTQFFFSNIQVALMPPHFQLERKIFSQFIDKLTRQMYILIYSY